MAEKNAFKEGLKKAQQFSAVHKAGGLSYFCTTSELANGDTHLLEKVMDGVNCDKKAKGWGKFIVSCDDEKVIGMCHVPSALSQETKVNAADWVTYFEECIPHLKITEKTDENGRILVDVNKEDEVFAFKLCSDLVDKNVQFLRKNGLIAQQSKEEDDDEIDFAASVGIEW